MRNLKMKKAFLRVFKTAKTIVDIILYGYKIYKLLF